MILADFRGLDTLVEITVIAVALLGVAAPAAPRAARVTTSLTRRSSRLLLGPSLVIAAASRQGLRGRRRRLQRRRDRRARRPASVPRLRPRGGASGCCPCAAPAGAVVGLLIALGWRSPVAGGDPPSPTGRGPGEEVVHIGALELITAVAFDVGVFLLVLGVVVGSSDRDRRAARRARQEPRMTLLFALAVGLLFGSGAYLLLKPRPVPGRASASCSIANAANLTLIAPGSPRRGADPTARRASRSATAGAGDDPDRDRHRPRGDARCCSPAYRVYTSHRDRRPRRARARRGAARSTELEREEVVGRDAARRRRSLVRWRRSRSLSARWPPRRRRLGRGWRARRRDRWRCVALLAVAGARRRRP